MNRVSGSGTDNGDEVYGISRGLDFDDRGPRVEAQENDQNDMDGQRDSPHF